MTFRFLKSMPARIVTGLLLVQSAVMYSSVGPEKVPNAPALSGFPPAIGPWQLRQEGFVDDETREVLKADDLLSRVYVDAGQARAADLFIAAFRSQRNGKAPHSPKNCLPGAGWTPLDQSEITIDVGRPDPIPVNRYIVAHGDSRSLVLYWYQSRDRAVASEYKAKFWVVADALRYHRSDTALIRVIVPVSGSPETAQKTAIAFVQSVFPTIRAFLPS